MGAEILNDDARSVWSEINLLIKSINALVDNDMLSDENIVLEVTSKVSRLTALLESFFSNDNIDFTEVGREEYARLDKDLNSLESALASSRQALRGKLSTFAKGQKGVKAYKKV